MKNYLVISLLFACGCSKQNTGYAPQSSPAPVTTSAIKIQMKDSKWAGVVVYEGGLSQVVSHGNDGDIVKNHPRFRISLCIDKSGTQQNNEISIPLNELGMPELSYTEQGLTGYEVVKYKEFKLKYVSRGRVKSAGDYVANEFAYSSEGPTKNLSGLISKFTTSSQMTAHTILDTTAEQSYYLSMLKQDYFESSDGYTNMYGCDGQDNSVVVQVLAEEELCSVTSHPLDKGTQGADKVINGCENRLKK